jgi:hypothetical protein
MSGAPPVGLLSISGLSRKHPMVLARAESLLAMAPRPVHLGLLCTHRCLYILCAGGACKPVCVTHCLVVSVAATQLTPTQIFNYPWSVTALSCVTKLCTRPHTMQLCNCCVIMGQKPDSRGHMYVGCTVQARACLACAVAHTPCSPRGQLRQWQPTDDQLKTGNQQIVEATQVRLLVWRNCISQKHTTER